MFKIQNEEFNIEKIADSGQCFRMNKSEDGSWQIIAGSRLCRAEEYPDDGYLTIYCDDKDNEFWKYYFDLDTDYSYFRKSADSEDTFLSEAVEYGKGIRILRQDPWEMLITFIISQRKNIPAIKACVEKLCGRWGSRIDKDVFAFPTPSQLSSASLEDLSCCSLGYRAEYVYLAAKAVSSGELDLKRLESYDDESLMDALLALKGVGVKVANCVSLFGFHRIAAFPVDVWIDRVQKEFYEGRFPVEKYEGYAGIMQQYIFYYARKSKA